MGALRRNKVCNLVEDHLICGFSSDVLCCGIYTDKARRVDPKGGSKVAAAT